MAASDTPSFFATLTSRFAARKDDPAVLYSAPSPQEKKLKDIEARDQTADKASQVVSTLLGVYKKRVRGALPRTTPPALSERTSVPSPRVSRGWHERNRHVTITLLGPGPSGMAGNSLRIVFANWLTLIQTCSPGLPQYFRKKHYRDLTLFLGFVAFYFSCDALTSSSPVTCSARARRHLRLS